jgi:vacuolar protein sorting-associated protein 54
LKYSNQIKLFKIDQQLKMMATVHQTQPTIQLLLSTNEFGGALDLISTTQEVLSQELAGVHCFR